MRMILNGKNLNDLKSHIKKYLYYKSTTLIIFTVSVILQLINTGNLFS